MKKEMPEMRKVEYGSPEYEEIMDLRNEYFRKPQGMDIRNEDNSIDEKSVMYGGYLDGKLMSCIFYLPKDENTAQVRAVIVDEKYQGIGAGKYLMDFIEEKIKSEGFNHIILHGRTKVEGFYEKLGYKSYGKVDIYNTIPHIWMEKDI